MEMIGGRTPWSTLFRNTAIQLVWSQYQGQYRLLVSTRGTAGCADGGEKLS